jgi:hypothetical protein
MKTVAQFILASMFLGLATNPVVAQTTNVVLRAYFVLNGLEQGNNQVINVRITNKDVLAALNATGNYHFGSGAQLVLISSDDQLPVVMVRETNPGQVTTTDVGAYFALADVGNEVHGPGNLTSWAYWSFNFDNGQGTDFKLGGLAAIYRRKITGPGIGPLTRADNAATSVYGAGGLNGTSTIFWGTIYAGFATAEVD